MITMYPGKVNSPIAELTADISASANSITITNGDVLPDAPNLATIGRGDIAETVRYTAKVGNVISGVERGFNGTVARAWTATTDIARYYTEYDHAAITGNIAEVGGNVSAHEAATDVHGATAAATPDRIAKRDAAGRMKAAAPAAADDVARKAEIDAHINDKANPHNVTKTQVGLSNVPNYPAATQAQAESGTDNATLMTPQRTNQLLGQRYRVNNGKFQYKDGTEWKEADGGLFVTTKPRTADLASSSYQNTYYTLLDVVGKGKLHRISATLQNQNNNYINVKVTIDGVEVILNTGHTGANRARGFAHNNGTSTDYGPNYSFDFFTEVSFLLSLKIEVGHTSSSQQSLVASADYSLV